MAIAHRDPVRARGRVHDDERAVCYCKAQHPIASLRGAKRYVSAGDIVRIWPVSLPVTFCCEHLILSPQGIVEIGRVLDPLIGNMPVRHGRGYHGITVRPEGRAQWPSGVAARRAMRDRSVPQGDKPPTNGLLSVRCCCCVRWTDKTVACSHKNPALISHSGP